YAGIESGYNLDIGQLHLKEGDVLKLYFSATDNCEMPKANQTRSADYYLSVIGQPQMERMLNEIMLRLKEDIRKTRDLQQQEISQTKELAAQAEKGNLDASRSRNGVPPSSAGQEQNLSQRVSAQRRVTQQLEQTAKELEQAIKDSQANKIWEETERDKISRLLENLKDEITAKSNQATAQLSQATQTPEPKAAQESLKNATATQQSVADDLKKALDKMQEWEDYQEILRLVRELLERQNKVVEEIKNSSR
ncbi:MAG: hypothetical protein HY762_00085, partial [Planctomycetes bacterium]|nr:hypothetical protein [Planctomycetota bacterium]